MATGIFISYRRDDSRHAAGRLADDLAQVFGERAIFRDIEGIDPGLDFTKSLERALNECVVMLVLIGPDWLAQTDAEGRRRLDQEGDWIRQEVATALARDVRVIPVLLEGARRPDAQELPEDIRVLAVRQTLEMSDSRWRGDLQRLIDVLKRVPELEALVPAPVPEPGPEPAPPPAPWPPPPAPAPSGRRQLFIGIALGVVGLIVIALMFGEDEFDGGGGAAALPPVSVGAGDMGNAARPNPQAPPVAQALPDISGMWRTTTGEVYHFDQDGTRVSFIAEAGGQDLGQGSGSFDGVTLRLALTLRVQGVVMGNANCDLQAGPQHESFAGMCMGPNGPFMAQMFR